MKKILSGLILLSLLFVLAVPIIASAASETPQECCQIGREITVDDKTCAENSWVGPTGGECDSTITCATDKWGMFCLLNGIYKVTDWIFLILVSIVVVMVIWGAFKILTAGGSPEDLETGRKYIVYACVGLVIALLAKAIPAIVRVMVGM